MCVVDAQLNLALMELNGRGTLEHRVQAMDEQGNTLSLWHDVPLKAADEHAGAYNFICEIPKCTRKKFEIATKEELNPIKQDEKKGTLREFKKGDM